MKLGITWGSRGALLWMTGGCTEDEPVYVAGEGALTCSIVMHRLWTENSCAQFPLFLGTGFLGLPNSRYVHRNVTRSRSDPWPAGRRGGAP